MDKTQFLLMIGWSIPLAMLSGIYVAPKCTIEGMIAIGTISIISFITLIIYTMKNRD